MPFDLCFIDNLFYSYNFFYENNYISCIRTYYYYFIYTKLSIELIKNYNFTVFLECNTFFKHSTISIAH